MQQEQVEVVEADGVLRVSLAGELDVTCARNVRAAISDVIGVDDVHRIEIDLGAVEFVDSTGIGVLVGVQQRARGAGQELVVVAVSPVVRRLLDLTETSLRYDGADVDSGSAASSSS